MMSKRIVVFVLAAAAAVFGAIALSQAASPPVIRSTKQARLRPRTDVAVAAALDRRFSILRSAQVAASSTGATLPAESAEHLTEPGTLVSEFKLEPAQVRYIDINGTHAWVIPGSNGICLGLPASDGNSISTGCGSLAGAGTNGLLMVQRSSSRPVIYGLVPNGDSVIVANQDGSSISVPVASNFFMYSGAAAQSVSVHNAGGSAVQTMTVGNSAGE